METIEVVYKPLVTVDGTTAYHETLVYTDSNGNTYYSYGAPTVPVANTAAGGMSAILNADQSAQDVATNTPSFFGTLTTNTNVPFDSEGASSIGITQDANGNAYPSEVITSGTDLSATWAAINSAENSIANQSLTYSLLTQNSNSLANTALVAAGLQPPTDASAVYEPNANGFADINPSSYWTPGGDTLLSGGGTPANQSFLTDNYNTSTTTDASGNTTTTITDESSSGNILNIYSFTSNASDTSVTSSIYNGSALDTTETITTNSDGSQIDNIQGFDTGGDLQFEQTTTTQADGDSSIATNLYPGILSPDATITFDPTTGATAMVSSGSADGSLVINGPDGSPLTFNSGGWSDVSSNTGGNVVVDLAEDGASSGTLTYDPSTGSLTMSGESDPDQPVTLDPDTWGDATDSDGQVQVTLKDSSGNSVGVLTFNSATGVSTVTSSDDSSYTFPPGGQLNFTVDRDDGGIDITYTDAPRGTWSGHINPLTGLIDNVSSTFSSTQTNGPFPDGGPLSDGPLMTFVNSLFNRGTVLADPIVLDLSGDNAGVQLTSLANSNAYFDLYDTGYAVHTGWVGPTTGILVDTPDPTNITDLFGSSTVNGFDALQALDVNGTGVINSNDPGFANLYVWEDTNGNGVVDPGEVQSLSSLGITSINLNSTEVNESVNGNVIGSVATFTYADGSTGQVAEAFFDNSQMDSVYTGSYTLNPETLTLPNLRGYGTVPDLYIAMSQDTTLLGMVQNLANGNLSDAATFDQQVTNIIYQWAGVENVGTTTSDGNVDGQDLAALEQFMGESFTETSGNETFGDSPANTWDGYLEEEAWNDLFMSVKERLLAQGPLASLLSGVSYDYDTDSLTGTADFSALVSAIGDNLPSDNATATQYLASLGQFVDQLASDLGVSASTYDTALQSLFAEAGINLSLSAIDNLHYVPPGYDSSNSADNNMLFVPDAPGAIIEGKEGLNNVVYTTSYLNVDEANDLTQAIICGVQTLETNNVTLTAAEFNGFSNIDIISGTTGAIYAATAGTYDLASENVTGTFNMTANDDGGTTLIGNNADGQTLTASALGNDTLIAGNGTGDILEAGGGVDTLVGGSGSTTFAFSVAPVAGTVIEGGTGANTLVCNAGDDISGLTISGVQTLETDSIALTASQLNGFTNIDSISGNGGTIYAESAGIYNLSDININGTFDVEVINNDGTTVIGSNTDDQVLSASSSGNDTLEAGNGNGEILYNGGGVDTLVGGDGSTTFDLSLFTVTAGTTIEGGSGDNTLVASSNDISGANISGVQTLEANNVVLTASELSGFTNIENTSPYAGTIYAETSGTYNLTNEDVSGTFNMIVYNNDGTTLIGNDADGQTLTASSSGNDTLEAGNGMGDILYGGDGVDTLIGGGGSTIFQLSSFTVTAGTIIEGGSGDNTLVASSNDISGATVTGVQTLEANNVVLNADELSSFTNIENTSEYSPGTIYAATGGTYNLADEDVTGVFNMIVNNSDGTTLIGNDADGQTLTASSSGNDTLEAGNGNGDILYGGDGVDTLIGGGGSTTFQLLSFTVTAGTTIEGGSGDNTLVASSNDISGATVTGVQTLETNNVVLTADELGGFTNIENTSAYSSGTIYAATGGTYDLANATVSGTFNMVANSNDGTTLIGDDADGQILTASASGNDTLEAGNGAGDTLNDGGGADTLIGGGGSTTIVLSSYAVTAGTTFEGGTGDTTLYAYSNDISGATVSGVQTLETANITLTAAELSNFTDIEGYYSTDSLDAAAAGTYDLANESVTGTFNMYVTNNDGTTLIGNDADGQILSASASGTDTLQAGNGSADELSAGGGTDTLIAGAGGDTLYGGSGYDYYQFGSNFGQATIVNSGGSAASGEVDFSTVDDNQLWFQQSGNNLLVDLLGTTQSITVSNWFSNEGSQVESFDTADGYKLDNQVSQLVSAMATYASNNPGFNPTTATSMPTDSTLQAALASAWHT